MEDAAHMHCGKVEDRNKPTTYGKVKKENEYDIGVSIFDSLW
jgi:hypothetical protein